MGKIILRYVGLVNKLLVKSITANVTLGKIALSKIIRDRFRPDTVLLSNITLIKKKFNTKNIKSEQKKMDLQQNSVYLEQNIYPSPDKFYTTAGRNRYDIFHACCPLVHMHCQGAKSQPTK